MELLGEKLPDDIEPVSIVNQTKSRPFAKVLKKILRVGIPGVLIGYFAGKWYRIEFKSAILRVKKIYQPSITMMSFQAFVMRDSFRLGVG